VGDYMTESLKGTVFSVQKHHVALCSDVPKETGAASVSASYCQRDNLHFHSVSLLFLFC